MARDRDGIGQLAGSDEASQRWPNAGRGPLPDEARATTPCSDHVPATPLQAYAERYRSRSWSKLSARSCLLSGLVTSSALLVGG